MIPHDYLEPATERHNDKFSHCFHRSKLMAKWRCVVCGYEYDEAEGCPPDGIAPGTSWSDISEEWTCFDCGAPKSDFREVDY